MKKSEAVLISAYTGFLLTKDFSDVHKYCEDVLGRPVFTHEFAIKEVHDDVKKALRKKIIELISNEEDDMEVNNEN